MFVCVFFCLFVYLFIYLFICLFVCLFQMQGFSRKKLVVVCGFEYVFRLIFHPQNLRDDPVWQV